MNDKTLKLRIDKWLWAARFYKTRQLAIKALNSKQIKLNGTACKPATEVQIGNSLVIKKGAYELGITVLEISDKRGPATVAQQLYQETDESKEKRERLRAAIAMQPSMVVDHRKPERRQIRSSRAFKRGD